MEKLKESFLLYFLPTLFEVSIILTGIQLIKKAGWATEEALLPLVLSAALGAGAVLALQQWLAETKITKESLLTLVFLILGIAMIPLAILGEFAKWVFLVPLALFYAGWKKLTGA